MKSKLKKRKHRNAQHSRVRFPGITDDAKRLGVSRPHLWMVLTGVRKSGSLTSRYQKLKTEVEK